jgi:predicted glycoside hydrolase/deacetylase ChbG (UPF0249 family)
MMQQHNRKGIIMVRNALEQETEKAVTSEQETEKAVSSYIETWAAHFGSGQDRKDGHRTIHFDERLGDVVEDVSSCLGVLPVLAEVMTSENWCAELASGFAILTQIVSEAAQKTMASLQQENRYLERNNNKALSNETDGQ